MGFSSCFDTDKVDAAAYRIIGIVFTVPINGVYTELVWLDSHFANYLSLNIVDKDIRFRFVRQREGYIGIWIEGIRIV